MKTRESHYRAFDLFLYLLGEARDQEAADLERHLGRCPHCAARARQEFLALSAPVWWLARTSAAGVRVAPREQTLVRAA